MDKRNNRPDSGIAVSTVLAVLGLFFFLWKEFSLTQAMLFLTGTGMGIALFHSAFGFSGGWKRFISGRESSAIRAQILLLLFSCILFFPFLAKIIPGVHVSAALAPVGVSVLVGAFLFGIGMQLGGGCGSGTLYTVGQGQVDMLVTLVFFIVGALIGSLHLEWWLSLPGIGKVSLIQEMGWVPALLLQVTVLVGLYVLVLRIDKSRNGSVLPVFSKPTEPGFIRVLVFGPWPAWWGAIALAGFGLATLLLAGYPWSITFAFGLWGAKIWNALGGDVSTWSYWKGGYPARAVNSSVLADVTSIMNYGIIMGAILASSLRGKFIPEDKVSTRRLITACLGGLLLGYGARLAFGCNIGALLGGVASGSLHGWLWMVFAFLGGILGVQLRKRIEVQQSS